MTDETHMKEYDERVIRAASMVLDRQRKTIEKLCEIVTIEDQKKRMKKFERLADKHNRFMLQFTTIDVDGNLQPYYGD